MSNGSLWTCWRGRRYKHHTLWSLGKRSQLIPQEDSQMFLIEAPTSDIRKPCFSCALALGQFVEWQAWALPGQRPSVSCSWRRCPDSRSWLTKAGRRLASSGRENGVSNEAYCQCFTWPQFPCQSGSFLAIKWHLKFQSFWFGDPLKSCCVLPEFLEDPWMEYLLWAREFRPFFQIY